MKLNKHLSFVELILVAVFFISSIFNYR